MKWLFVIKEKFKIALYLTVIFIISITANLFERSQVNEVDKSIISMYNDRIIPAKDIFMILEYFYKNQLLVQEHMHASQEKSYLQIEASIQANQLAIDSLTARFEKTYLVDKEVSALHIYKTKVAQYKKIQDHIVFTSKKGLKDESYTSYQEQGQKAFQEIIDPLNQLADIQVYVGKELYTESHQKLAGSKIVSSLEIAIAIVIGIIANLLLKASDLINRTPHKPNLN